MHKNPSDSPGHEAMPSLLASRDAASESSVDAAERAEGILSVVSHGHARGRSHLTWRQRVGPVAVVLLVSVLVWWAWSPRAGSAPAHEEVSSAQRRPPELAPAWPAPSSEDAHTSASVAPPPSAARIELAEAPATQRPRVEAQTSGAGGAALSEPSSAAQQPIPGARREALRTGRHPGETVRRPVARTADPDVEVIEVLMSRAVPEQVMPRQAPAGHRPTAAAPDRDVVLVQTGVPTAELVRRCLALGWLEGQLCRARVCAARHDDEAACPRQAAALGSP